MDEIVIATRRSALAMTQAERVAGLIRRVMPDTVTTLRPVTTSGDGDRSTPVWALTEVGAFVRAVQEEVIAGRADLAVHSCKDLPTAGPESLVVFYPERLGAGDVLCGETLDGLGRGSRVGTGSPRRAAQLAELRPDVEVCDIRGNVGTRLARVESGEYAAVVLAEAGLQRLGRASAITQVFGLEEMVPAPAQGALAVEALAGSRGAAIAAEIDDELIRRSVETERILLASTGAGCRSALGALALADGGPIEATGFVSDERGPRRGRAAGDDPRSTAEALARELGL